MWDAELSAPAYPTRESFVRDCVPVLRRELELIRDAGADIAQIDDPHLCLFVDPGVRAGYDDADRAADFSVAMVNEVVDGIDGIPPPPCTCGRRAGARARGEEVFSGGYGPIVGQLNRLRVQHLDDGVHGTPGGWTWRCCASCARTWRSVSDVSA